MTSNAHRRPEEKTLCRTPTPGKSPVRIDTWKFDVVAGLIRSLVKDAGDEGILFRDLRNQVKKKVDRGELNDLGSVAWYTTTVKLEMEVRGELKRSETRPQRLYLAS